MKINKNIFKKLIRESISKILKEEFYLYDESAAADPQHDRGWSIDQPLSRRIVDYLADLEELPRFENRMDDVKFEAEGAEGIVVSLDNFRVIKIFHDIINAAKNLEFVSSQFDNAARVFSHGVINLNKPVVYWKKGSTLNRMTKNKPVDKLYYIIMERIVPDNYVFQNIEIVLDKISRISNLGFNNLLTLSELNIQSTNSIIDELFQAMLLDPVVKQLLLENNLNFTSFLDFISQNLSRKLRNKCTAAFSSSFSNIKKSYTKNSIFVENSGKNLCLKHLILNHLGIINTFPDHEIVLGFLKQFLSTGIKRKLPNNTNTTLLEDLEDIINLVNEVINVNGVAWADIHKEQFGRRNSGELVALDVGSTGNLGNIQDPSVINNLMSQFTASNIIDLDIRDVSQPNPPESMEFTGGYYLKPGDVKNPSMKFLSERKIVRAISESSKRRVYE